MGATNTVGRTNPTCCAARLDTCSREPADKCIVPLAPIFREDTVIGMDRITRSSDDSLGCRLGNRSRKRGKATSNPMRGDHETIRHRTTRPRLQSPVQHQPQVGASTRCFLSLCLRTASSAHARVMRALEADLRADRHPGLGTDQKPRKPHDAPSPAPA